MGWRPSDMPKDKHSSAWGRWMMQRRSRAAMRRKGIRQPPPPVPLTREQRRAEAAAKARAKTPTTLPLE